MSKLRTAASPGSRIAYSSSPCVSQQNRILPVVRDLIRSHRPDPSRQKFRDGAVHGVYSVPDGLTGRRTIAPGRRNLHEYAGRIFGNAREFPRPFEGGTEASIFVHEAFFEGLGAGPHPASSQLLEGLRLQRAPRSTATGLTFSLPRRPKATGRVRITPIDPVIVFLRATMRLAGTET